jgi:hypothetical protein
MKSMYEPQSSDTSEEADRIQFEMLRGMSPQERLALMTELTLSAQRLAFAGLRLRYPNASDDEIWLRLAARRLGIETVRKIYGWRPDEE